jgi:hypothetical protein
MSNTELMNKILTHPADIERMIGSTRYAWSRELAVRDQMEETLFDDFEKKRLQTCVDLIVAYVADAVADALNAVTEPVTEEHLQELAENTAKLALQVLRGHADAFVYYLARYGHWEVVCEGSQVELCYQGLLEGAPEPESV